MYRLLWIDAACFPARRFRACRPEVHARPFRAQDRFVFCLCEADVKPLFVGRRLWKQEGGRKNVLPYVWQGNADRLLQTGALTAFNRQRHRVSLNPKDPMM